MSALFDVPEPATLGTPAHDDPAMGKPWTEDDVLRVLWRHFVSQSWACVPQVTVSMRDLPGYVRQGGLLDRLEDAQDRRIDMLAVRTPRKRGLGALETLALEVKVTRADFLNDVRHPEKQAPWRRAATRHAYVVPAGLVTADEVPEGSGLLAVKHRFAGWGDVEWVRRAPYAAGHAPALPTRPLLALLHRSSTLEASTRGWQSSPEAAGDPQELRAALAAAHKAVEKAERRADKAEGKAEAWKVAHALAAPQGHPCRWCGRPLKPLHPSGGRFKKWRHADTTDDAPCELAEAAAAEREAREAYDAADDQERGRAERLAHRWGFSDAVGAEPWRAFLPPAAGAAGTFTPTGPEPADVTPGDAP